MKTRTAGLVLALTLLGAASPPAVAQYYPGWGPPPPPSVYYDRRYRGAPDYYGYPPRESYYYGRRRQALRNVCITSRGNCSTGQPLPSGSPCRCYIPGFGEKRGAVP